MKNRALLADLTDNRESSYKKYLRIFVGDDSVISFLRYEILTGLLGTMPFSLGYFLRSKLYKWLVADLGKGSVFGMSVVLRSPSNIFIGNGVMIDDGVVLDAKGKNSRIKLTESILLGRNTILSCNEAVIDIERFVSIGPNCFFASKSEIKIGSNTAIGPGTHIMAGTHSFDDPHTPIINQERISEGIIIENNCWIGSGAKLLDGIKVGHDSIVGAGSVVHQDVPPWTMVLGNPARVVKKREHNSND